MEIIAGVVEAHPVGVEGEVMAEARSDSGVVRSGRYFHLFVCGTAPGDPRPAALPEGCEQVTAASVPGTLYDLDDSPPALVLAGHGSVAGEVWRCPVEVLIDLDADERVQAGYLRRVGVQVGEYPCWAYVAGPKLARWLVPGRRKREVRGRPAAG
jgi:gamma-glutamylcyclotransferase (GGCT)/AIG2-like uncharacterized protein YtfP